VAGNAGGGHGVSVGSWIACLVIIAGFTLGGAALIIWNWPMFWVGVGVVVIGCIVGGAVNIMEDVLEYGPSGSGSSDLEPSS
jgi:hypothetical protein